MDIIDNKSPQIGSFLKTLDELSNTIQQTLQNRTPHLNNEKYLTNREVCQLLRISWRRSNLPWKSEVVLTENYA